LELAEEDKQECNYCPLDYDDPTLLNFDTAPATHQMVALEEDGGNADIVFICKDCKKIMITMLFHNVKYVAD